MGARCYDCGEKMGRCYEHGGAVECDCLAHYCIPSVEYDDSHVDEEC